MTVRELIALLSSLSEAEQDRPVVMDDSDYGREEIRGIRWEDDGRCLVVHP
jgi:hypothetical protein